MSLFKDTTHLIYRTHLHLQSGEQFRFDLPQLHFEQSPLQLHLMSSLHALETSGVVIQTGTHESDSLAQAYCAGEGTTCCVSGLVVQIPA